ncbi:uncharacterized protein LOC135366682 [Ornithodoros turicata]|uniref:uncharacterized protein LOC135366682 n=1 Tax=Ornithodoros turicata TaxID=34597 RepID=UPI003139F0E2
MHSFVLRLVFFLICGLQRALTDDPHVDYVPVQDNASSSTMYLWRPINVFFVADPSFDALQNTIVMPGQLSELYMYTQSMLNMLSFMYREEYPGCDIKLRTSGTHVMTSLEVDRYMPTAHETGYFNRMWINVSEAYKIQDFVEQYTPAKVADIVIMLTGFELHLEDDWYHWKSTWYNSSAKMCSAEKLIVFSDSPYSYASMDDLKEALLSMLGSNEFWKDGKGMCTMIRDTYRNALAGRYGMRCYNTPDICCIPSFFGIFNMRANSFCTGKGLYFNHTVADDGPCWTACLNTLAIVKDGSYFYTSYLSPTGWVWDPASDYRSKSLLCPRPEDKICSGFRKSSVGYNSDPKLGYTYKKFQRILSYIWELDDYELPDMDPEICRLQKK